MSKNIIKIFILSLILFLSWTIYKTWVYKKPSVIEKPAPEIHIAVAEAPDFSLESLSGEQISLSSFKGKGVILFFWATWCPHCRSALGELNTEYANIKNSNIEVLAIDIDESKARVENFIKKYSLGYPVLLDVGGEVSSQYNVVGIPSFILISKDGKIVKISHSIPSNYKDLLK